MCFSCLKSLIYFVGCSYIALVIVLDIKASLIDIFKLTMISLHPNDGVRL